MEGKKVNLVAPAGLYAALGISTAQDFSGWPFKSYVFDPSAPTVALEEITVAADFVNRQILLTLSEAKNAALVDEGQMSADLAYVVYTKPSSAPEVRLFYGGYKAVIAGPASGIV
jgi:hypothetical protein